MVRRLEIETTAFPANIGGGVWHLHLPVAQGFIDSQATPLGIHRLCVATLIHRAHHLAINKPDNGARVIVAVTLPELWNSTIMVFFGVDDFADFFSRNRDGQKWMLTNERLSERWKIELHSGFTERVFAVDNSDDDGANVGQIWFVGQIEN